MAYETGLNKELRPYVYELINLPSTINNIETYISSPAPLTTYMIFTTILHGAKY